MIETDSNTEQTPVVIDAAPARKPGTRGFAKMPPEQQRAIASQGGKTAHARGAAHKFTSKTGAAAGRKGGEAVSKDIAHMEDIGRRGGLARSESMRQRFSMSMTSLEVSVDSSDGVTITHASAQQVRIESTKALRK